jgi:hypothetical protein
MNSIGIKYFMNEDRYDKDYMEEKWGNHTVNTPPIHRCKFCKCDEVYIDKDLGLYYIECRRCLARGPSDEDLVGAIREWNSVWNK